MSRRPSSRRLHRVLAALVAGAFLATAAALPATASPAPAAPKDTSKLQTFGIGPANADGLDSRAAFVYEGRPGTVVKDRFALVNYTTKPVKVRVYASDAFTTDGGAFDLLAGGQKPSDVGSWTRLKPQTVTIPARARSLSAPPAVITIPFTVRVPAQVSPGDHAGGIVASVQTKPAAQAGANSVVVDRRVGTRIYVRVPGALDPKLEITNLKATYEGTLNPVGRGSVRVSYRVKNTGNVVVSSAQRVRVQGLLGTSAQGPTMPDLLQLLPDGDVQVSTVVTGVIPAIRVKAVVELDPYTGTAEAKQPLPPVSASTSLWAIPWTLIALLLALAAITYYLNRRRRRAPSSTPDLTEIDDDVVMVP